MRPSSRIALTLVLVAGCGAGGVDVSTRSLRRAQRTWEQARLRDYDLEWRSTGRMAGHYLVYVRDGRVREVRRILDDPRQIKLNRGTAVLKARTADPQAFGVDGLFRILEEELDAAQSDNPFGAPKGSRVLMKFVPDDALGYPRSYRRDVVGARAGLAIDVVRLETHPSQGIPPLPHE
jgi:hypothetical protein